MKRRLIVGTINFYEPEEGWINFHLDKSNRPIWHPGLKGFVLPEYVMDAANMDQIGDGEFNEVRMHHSLEHLTARAAVSAVAEVHRVLVPGGCFDVEVPDLDRICAAWMDGSESRDGLLQWIYGESIEWQDEHLNAHRWGYTAETLIALLSDAGFQVGEREDTGLALRYRAVKDAQEHS